MAVSICVLCYRYHFAIVTAVLTGDKPVARPFHLVDVFGTRPFTGNPLPVIADSDGLSTEDMQSITRWFNHSETTFLVPATDPNADYRVRIFTISHELPFAGHPTLGSAHAWLEGGGKPKRDGVIVQECGAGLVTVRRDRDRLAFAAPPLIRGGRPDGAGSRARSPRSCRLSAQRLSMQRGPTTAPGG